MRIYLPLAAPDRPVLERAGTRIALEPGRTAWAVTAEARTGRPAWTRRISSTTPAGRCPHRPQHGSELIARSRDRCGRPGQRGRRRRGGRRRIRRQPVRGDVRTDRQLPRHRAGRRRAAEDDDTDPAPAVVRRHGRTGRLDYLAAHPPAEPRAQPSDQPAFDSGRWLRRAPRRAAPWRRRGAPPSPAAAPAGHLRDQIALDLDRAALLPGRGQAHRPGEPRRGAHHVQPHRTPTSAVRLRSGPDCSSRIVTEDPTKGLTMSGTRSVGMVSSVRTVNAPAGSPSTVERASVAPSARRRIWVYSGSAYISAAAGADSGRVNVSRSFMLILPRN